MEIQKRYSLLLNTRISLRSEKYQRNICIWVFLPAKEASGSKSTSQNQLEGINLFVCLLICSLWFCCCCQVKFKYQMTSWKVEYQVIAARFLLVIDIRNTSSTSCYLQYSVSRPSLCCVSLSILENIGHCFLCHDTIIYNLPTLPPLLT